MHCTLQNRESARQSEMRALSRGWREPLMPIWTKDRAAARPDIGTSRWPTARGPPKSDVRERLQGADWAMAPSTILARWRGTPSAQVNQKLRPCLTERE